MFLGRAIHRPGIPRRCAPRDNNLSGGRIPDRIMGTAYEGGGCHPGRPCCGTSEFRSASTGRRRPIAPRPLRPFFMLDLAHLNEQGFWDVASLSSAPLVVTHAAAHAICPSARNLTDLQLDAVRDSHGVVGLNFEVSSNRPDSHDDADTPLTVLVDQIDYLVDRMGIDCVAFGSDFDGARMPAALGDVAGLPRLIAALHDRGYDEPALRKLAHENWLRLLGATWRV